VQNVNELCDSHQSCRVYYKWNASQYLARLNNVLISVMPLMIPILRYTEHINFVRSSV
jgi:hypothetical protein